MTGPDIFPNFTMNKLSLMAIGEAPPEDTNFLDYYDQAVSALEAVKA